MAPEKVTNGTNPCEERLYSIVTARLSIYAQGQKEIEKHYPFAPESQAKLLTQWQRAYDHLLSLVFTSHTSLHPLDAIDSLSAAAIKTHARRRNKTDMIAASEEQQKELYNAYVIYNASFLPSSDRKPPQFPVFSDYWQMIYNLEESLSPLPSNVLLTFPAVGRYIKEKRETDTYQAVLASRK